jgi:hypothetical protein
LLGIEHDDLVVDGIQDRLQLATLCVQGSQRPGEMGRHAVDLRCELGELARSRDDRLCVEVSLDDAPAGADHGLQRPVDHVAQEPDQHGNGEQDHHHP